MQVCWTISNQKLFKVELKVKYCMLAINAVSQSNYIRVVKRDNCNEFVSDFNLICCFFRRQDPTKDGLLIRSLPHILIFNRQRLSFHRTQWTSSSMSFRSVLWWEGTATLTPNPELRMKLKNRYQSGGVSFKATWVLLDIIPHSWVGSGDVTVQPAAPRPGTMLKLAQTGLVQNVDTVVVQSCWELQNSLIEILSPGFLESGRRKLLNGTGVVGTRAWSTEDKVLTTSSSRSDEVELPGRRTSSNQREIVRPLSGMYLLLFLALLVQTESWSEVNLSQISIESFRLQTLAIRRLWSARLSVSRSIRNPCKSWYPGHGKLLASAQTRLLSWQYGMSTTVGRQTSLAVPRRCDETHSGQHLHRSPVLMIITGWWKGLLPCAACYAILQKLWWNIVSSRFWLLTNVGFKFNFAKWVVCDFT